MKNKNWYLIDVKFSTDKKLATAQDRQTLQCRTPLKRNINSIASYVWLFLKDFPQTKIAC